MTLHRVMKFSIKSGCDLTNIFFCKMFNEVESDVDTQGVQSYTQKCIWKGKPCIMKTSKHVDFVPELEFNAWTRLKLLNSPDIQCPHFCEIYDKTSSSSGKSEKCLFFREILLRLPNGESGNMSLGDIIFEDCHHPIGLINCVNQTIAAILMMEKVGITHYDLHSDNVMIDNTPFDVHVYINQSEQDPRSGPDIAIFETYGITPVVIDFGISYVPDTELNATSVFTDSGFTTFMNDPLVDTRLLLTTTKKDFIKYLKRKSDLRPTGKPRRNFKSILAVKRYKEQITRALTPLKSSVDKKTGWLKENTFPNIVHNIVTQIKSLKLKRRGGLFHTDNVKWFLELLQHRISVPLKDESLGSEVEVMRHNFTTSFLDFVIEWLPVEHIIRNTKEELFFFKDLVSEIDSIKMKHRYPEIKNIAKLRSCIDALTISLKCEFIKVQKEIKVKREELYSVNSYQTTNELFKRLPRQPVQFKNGMSMLICDMRRDLVTYNQLHLDQKTVDLLNDNVENILGLIK